MLNLHMLASSTLKVEDGVVVRKLQKHKRQVECNRLAHNALMSKAMRKVYGGTH